MAAARTKRRLPKAERRALIEQSAAALFAERGYGQTQMEEIAAAAGISKQLLYRHFSSKKELYLALLRKGREEILATLAQSMARPGSLAARLPRMIEDWLAYVEEHPFAAALLFHDTTGDPEVQALYAENHAAARAANVALMRAEPELRVPEDQLEPLAELMRAAITGLAVWWAGHREVPRAALAEVAAGFLIGGLGLGKEAVPPAC